MTLRMTTIIFPPAPQPFFWKLFFWLHPWLGIDIARLYLVFLDDVLDVHEDEPDQLDEGDDEGAEGRSAEVIA